MFNDKQLMETGYVLVVDINGNKYYFNGDFSELSRVISTAYIFTSIASITQLLSSEVFSDYIKKQVSKVNVLDYIVEIKYYVITVDLSQCKLEQIGAAHG